MKKTKKGFTLVELLVTIILLGVIGAIIIYNMTSVSTSSKETEYERFVAAVKSAAAVYADLNPDAFSDLYVNKAFIYITVEDLIQDGLLDENLVNPYTEEKIGLEELVKANLDSMNGAVVFEYPVVDKKDEQFLVAISDYVVWGEPYDCMQGIGSYQLSLSEENGDLIVLNEDTIKEYNFECQMPDNFVEYNENGVTGLHTTESGNYEVTYTWITKSGTRKSATRTLRVLAKVKPSFKTNYDYSFDGKEVFETSYDETTKSWKYLTYEPYIEGADQESTTYRVTKQSNVGTNKKVEKVTVNPATNDYLVEPFVKPVDDGDKTYYIDVIVKGHYVKEYSYEASGKAVMKAELIIPKSYITVPNINDWATERDYHISDGIHSPVGIDKFEFKLTTDSSVAKDTVIIPANLFDKVLGGVTIKNVSVFNAITKCDDGLKEFTNVFFRAINEDGYAGKWTPYDAKLSNQLSKLINADSRGCTDSDSCCLLASGGTSCYYTSKVKYASFGGVRFIILEKYNNGTILATYDGVSDNLITPTTLAYGHAREVTCDLTVYKDFDYSSPVLQNIIDEGDLFLQKLPENHLKYMIFDKWSASAARVIEYTGTSTQWGDDSRGDPSKDKSYYKVEIDSSYKYNSYVGNVTTEMFTRYHSALYEDEAYWTNDTYASPFTVYLNEPRPHCNESTTAYNVYFYYISGANTIKQTYVGKEAKVKPIVKFTGINICAGDGSYNNPYIIGYTK